MPQSTCRHVHANGALCQSPPLRHRDYCHFHLDQIGRQLRAARARARSLPSRLNLPLLEDPFAVQVALMQIADAITHNELDVPRGRMLMSVLRLAARNLKEVRNWKQQPLFTAEANPETAISEWPSFEQENTLPPDFDLSVDPEVAFPPALPLHPYDGLNTSPGSYRDDRLPLDPTARLSREPERDLTVQIRQALGDAKEPLPLVTADQVELMDIYERQGPKAATRFAEQMVRNDRRRERRLQRAHYEEVARNHTIRLAARKLTEQQQREASAAPIANTQATGCDAGGVEVEKPRKKPVSRTPAAARPDVGRSPATA